jgi:hypothetical protein
MRYTARRNNSSSAAAFSGSPAFNGAHNCDPQHRREPAFGPRVLLQQSMRRDMRDYLSTAAMFLSIFVVVAMMFIGPKGFSLSPDKPVVASVPEAASK